MSSKVILSLLLILLLIPSLSAQNGKQYHLKLLAVQEEGTTYIGSNADLYLELKEGTGRVFLDTFPLTKADTQISTRFAKDIACTHFKLDCDYYDFIFTIRATSNIVGGPSAGAAAAALTTIAVLDLPYTQDVAVTGTINSGGIIGPVGGVKEK
ncbi:MAG: S16 family serine protease, partial [Nanoarchaeota archaeon]